MNGRPDRVTGAQARSDHGGPGDRRRPSTGPAAVRTLLIAAVSLLAAPALARPADGGVRCPDGQGVVGFDAARQPRCGPSPERPRRAKKPVAPAAAARPAGGARAVPDPATFVRPAGPDRFQLDRGVVNQMMTRPDLRRLARFRPTFDGDRVSGYRILDVKPGTLPSALGLQDGDVVRTVGGFALNNPRMALQAWLLVGRADRVDVVLERAGQVKTLTYEIGAMP